MCAYLIQKSLEARQVEGSSERGNSAKVRKERKPLSLAIRTLGSQESDMRKMRFLPSRRPQACGGHQQGDNDSRHRQPVLSPIQRDQGGFPEEVAIGQHL